MARVVLDEEAWAAVRADYEDTDEAVHRIAHRFGIDRNRIFHRAARDGWRMRSVRTSGPSLRPSPASSER